MTGRCRIAIRDSGIFFDTPLRPLNETDMNSIDQKALDYHRAYPAGKIGIRPTKPTDTQEDLSLAYTPGVAAPTLAIADNPEAAYDYTSKGNLVAVISNGTAILGLGNKGAAAAKPVMEGKGVLFKRFADIDVFDIEINEKDPEKIVDIVASISNLTIPTTGAMTWENSYFEMKFTEKAMNFREGFWYKLNIPFKENVKIEGATEDTEDKVLTGTFNLLLKIVPEYVVWTGDTDGDRNWNNDEHWKRATAADLYDEDGSRAEQYHEGEHYDDAYAPMYFTNVIIQNGEEGKAYSAYPYLYELKDKDNEREGLLNMDVPEDMENVIGDATENIEYDLMVDPLYEKV